MKRAIQNRRGYLAVLILVTGLLAMACSPVNQLRVIPLDEYNKKQPASLVYALPRTVLEVEVKLSKNIFVPGPYAKFADDFLQIEHARQNDSTWWQFEKAGVSTFLEADPGQVYAVTARQPALLMEDLLEMTTNGLAVLPPHGEYKTQLVTRQDNLDMQQPVYTDMTVKRNLVEKVDTLYKTFITDSAFTRVPVIKKNYGYKPIEKKAEEAANFIIKLRKRRFKLIAGQYETYPEGSSLAISVEELDKLEDEYLSLFTGKTFSSEYSYTFYITPVKDTLKSVNTYSIVGISPEDGPVEPGEGEDVSVEIEEGTRYPVLQAYDDEFSGSTLKDGLYYRVPGDVIIRIKKGDQVLFTGKALISQFGNIVPLKTR